VAATSEKEEKVATDAEALVEASKTKKAVVLEAVDVSNREEVVMIRMKAGDLVAEDKAAEAQGVVVLLENLVITALSMRTCFNIGTRLASRTSVRFCLFKYQKIGEEEKLRQKEKLDKELEEYNKQASTAPVALEKQ
jgi:hypothetical protein